MIHKITTTATFIPEKLTQEIEKAIAKYNENTQKPEKIVFVEEYGYYSLSTLKYDSEGNISGHHKIGIESLQEMLSYCAAWRTRANGDPELGWIVQGGGYCPKRVALYAARRSKPDNMPKIPVYSLVYGVYSMVWEGE